MSCGLRRLCVIPTTCHLRTEACPAIGRCTPLLVFLHTNLRPFPLASRDAAVEHDINLTVGSTLHLRQLEICDDEAKQSGSTPDVAALAANCVMSATIIATESRVHLRSPPVGFSIYEPTDPH